MSKRLRWDLLLKLLPKPEGEQGGPSLGTELTPIEEFESNIEKYRETVLAGRDKIGTEIEILHSQLRRHRFDKRRPQHAVVAEVEALKKKAEELQAPFNILTGNREGTSFLTCICNGSLTGKQIVSSHNKIQALVETYTSAANNANGDDSNPFRPGSWKAFFKIWKEMQELWTAILGNPLVSTSRNAAAVLDEDSSTGKSSRSSTGARMPVGSGNASYTGNKTSDSKSSRTAPSPSQNDQLRDLQSISTLTNRAMQQLFQPRPARTTTFLDSSNGTPS